MEQKRVSFKVAKALKDAGYTDTFITDKNENQVYILFSDEPDNYITYQSASIQGYLNEGYLTRLNIEWYFAPTYIDVWLWLWREKKICINCNYDKYNMPPMWWCNNEDRINYNAPNFEDPEDAIINAIEFLVDNDLIK